MRSIVILCLLMLTACATTDTANKEFKAGLRYYYDDINYLNYRSLGSGEKTLILLHGYGASNHNWDDLIPLLNLQGYRLLIFDLVGSGHSSKPLDQDHSMAANAVHLRQFILDYKIKNYTLMGHSFGGGVALIASILAQTDKTDTPQGLVLVAPAAYKSRLPIFIGAARLPGLASLAVKALGPRLISKISLRRVFHQDKKITPVQVSRYKQFIAQAGYAGAMRQTARDIVPKNYKMLIGAYSSIAIPTLVVWGEEDTILPLDSGIRLVAKLQNAQLLRISDCGHNVLEECPEPLAAAINALLAPA